MRDRLLKAEFAILLAIMLTVLGWPAWEWLAA
jgi:hypothetical protein